MRTDKDVQVVREDQQRINLFARKNARLADLREKIATKEVKKNNGPGLAL